jgi:phosphatidate phosphatase APP1
MTTDEPARLELHQTRGSTMWRDRLEKLAQKVEEKLETQRDRLPGRGSRPARIEPYRGFGCADRAFAWGRVLRGSALPPADADDSVWTNLGRMAGRFYSDEVPGARVRVRFPGGEHVVTADEEGFFQCWFDPRPPFAGGGSWRSVTMELVVPAEGPPASRAEAPVLVPPPSARFGVISDLDDTVLRTDVTRTLRMARTVLTGNARTREPFPGVSAFYRALARGGEADQANPVFYVSSSPWNLYDLLAEFMDVQRIPRGPLLLRDWGLSQGEPGEGGHAGHKLAAIRRIMDLFPALPFLLIGDSGQEDPEIYHRVVHQYPDRVLAVYVRSVAPATLRREKIRLLAEEVRAAGSTLLLTDDTLAAARHAASRGWIAPAAVDEVAAESGGSASPPAPDDVQRANAAASTVRPG